MNMRKPAVFFDWDGTLADSMELCVREIQTALREMGHSPVPEAVIRRCNGPTYAESVAILGLTPEEGPLFLRLRVAAEMRLVPTVQKLFPGVPGMLRELRDDFDLFIVSNGMPDYLALSLRQTGVADCFVRAQALIPGKTKPEVLHDLLAELQPPRAVMIGDRLGDVEAGVQNHLPVIAACYGYGSAAEWEQASGLAGSAAEIPALVRKLTNGG